jgi:hypothetical protein
MFLKSGNRFTQPGACNAQRHLRKLGAALIAICCGIAVAEQPNLAGLITDSEGAAIGHALVYIHWDPSGSGVGLKTNLGLKQDLVLTTDKAGRFYAALPPGFYDVFVSAPAFSPECRKLRVRPGEPARYAAKLSADPSVTKEIGDTMPH